MDLQQKNEEIIFPVSFRLKIISIMYDSEKSAFDRFTKVLEKNKIKHSNWDSRPSSGGKYASYRVDVTIDDDDSLRKLYSDLGDVEGVKCVI